MWENAGGGLVVHYPSGAGLGDINERDASAFMVYSFACFYRQDLSPLYSDDTL